MEPDISVICDPNKLNDKGCAGARTGIIEIVSSGSRRMDYSIKLFKYRSQVSGNTGLLTLTKTRITVHDLMNEDINEYTFADSVKTGIYEDLSIDLDN